MYAFNYAFYFLCTFYDCYLTNVSVVCVFVVFNVFLLFFISWLFNRFCFIICKVSVHKEFAVHLIYFSIFAFFISYAHFDYLITFYLNIKYTNVTHISKMYLTYIYCFNFLCYIYSLLFFNHCVWNVIKVSECCLFLINPEWHTIDVCCLSNQSLLRDAALEYSWLVETELKCCSKTDGYSEKSEDLNEN